MNRHFPQRLAGTIGTSAALLVLATGCVTLETTAERNARIRRDQQVSVQMARMNSQWDQRGRDLAALRAEEQVLLENHRRLAADLQASRQEAAAVKGEVARLQLRLDLVDRQLASVDANYKKRLEQLQRSVALEGKTRKDAINQVITSVSQEIEKTATKLQVEQQRMLKSAAGTPGGQKQYTVVAGDCLSAIAQAFEVTIEGIKKANALKGDLIHPEQTLVIPAKAGN